MRGAKKHNEPFDDQKLYDEDGQGFGRIVVRNHDEVLSRYSFERYERRFRERADGNELSSGQRPKLDENQFAKLIGELRKDLLRSREADPLSNPVNRKAVLRLLLTNDFEDDEEWR
jgi:hypothetical protein